MPIGVKGDRNGSDNQLLPFDVLETINVFSAGLCEEDLKRTEKTLDGRTIHIYGFFQLSFLNGFFMSSYHSSQFKILQPKI